MLLITTHKGNRKLSADELISLSLPLGAFFSLQRTDPLDLEPWGLAR